MNRADDLVDRHVAIVVHVGRGAVVTIPQSKRNVHGHNDLIDAHDAIPIAVAGTYELGYRRRHKQARSSQNEETQKHGAHSTFRRTNELVGSHPTLTGWA